MSKEAGLTVIEVTVVIGLFVILIALGLLLSLDVWRGNSFRSEQDIVISLLYKARSRAISNINEHDHGLRIDKGSGKYVLFEVGGDDVPFEMSGNFDFTVNGGDSCEDVTCEFIFEARTGDRTSATDSFTMGGQGKNRTVDINPEGGITW